MKSMKKMVLAGLILLASVVVLLPLVGCKSEVEAVKVYTFPAAVKVLTDYESPNNTGSEWTYVEFGEWPQSEADISGVDLEEVEGGRGYFKDNYYKDDNDNYYVKHNDSYYKVEPIVWRVLNKDYSGTGKALLLAEKILIGGIPWDESINNYMESNIRKWLNGNEGSEPKSDYKEGTGFLQTAFTDEALKCIAETTVDNSKESTFGRGELQEDNPYACDNTSDKIFLLSQQEATTEGYGFDVYDAYGEYGKGNTRIRVTTDYANKTGVLTEIYHGWWWLRSPNYESENVARGIYYNFGPAYSLNLVDNGDGGVVPALCIQLQ